MQFENAVKEYAVNGRGDGLAGLVPELRRSGGSDLHTALLLMKMFEDSHPELRSELGDCYYQGDGVSQDVDKALEKFKAAAAMGSVRSQYDLGWYYYDRGEWLHAIEYFTVCLSHKDELDDKKLSGCYGCLGDAYLNISEPKIQTAIENLAIAADRYHRGFACRRLGMLYSEAGKPYFDPEKAVRYYELGAENGDILSAHTLAIDYIFGNEELHISPNGRKAEELLLRYEDSGDDDIMCALGLLYRRGDVGNGVAKDYRKSQQYYERSWAVFQRPVVASDLGFVYFSLSEYAKAEQMLLTAHRLGQYDYMDFLGRIYKNGYLGTKDSEKAEYYYALAYTEQTLNNVFTCAEYSELLEERGKYQKAYEVADYGEKRFNDIWFVYIKASLVLDGKVNDTLSAAEAAEMMKTCIRYKTHEEEANMALGRYYLNAGEFRNAEKHFLDAFGLGVAHAGVLLGRLYEKGGGTISADPNKAFEWFSKAAEAGSEAGAEEAACFKKGIFGGYRRTRSLQ